MANSEHRLPFTYLAVLAAAVACYAALGAVLFILPRHVPDRLGGGPAAVGLAVGAPALTGLLARPLGGRLGDRLGPLLPLLGGATVMAAGAVPAAASPTLAALLASRLAVGAGEGLMMSAAVLWLLQLAGEARRGRALGHIGLANYGGLALGPLLATALGGAAGSSTVLWTAVGLPGLGAAAGSAAWVMSGRATRRTGDRAAADRPVPTAALLRRTVPAGVGLLLVNVGYVSVLSFGPSVARDHATGVGTLVVPVFAAAGLFFAWFDAGVGLGGPAVGAAASVAGAGGALNAAAAAVSVAIAIGIVAGRVGGARQPSRAGREMFELRRVL